MTQQTTCADAQGNQVEVNDEIFMPMLIPVDSGTYEPKIFKGIVRAKYFSQRTHLWTLDIEASLNVTHDGSPDYSYNPSGERWLVFAHSCSKNCQFNNDPDALHSEELIALRAENERLKTIAAL